MPLVEGLPVAEAADPRAQALHNQLDRRTAHTIIHLMDHLVDRTTWASSM
jgi:hypothetical protein